MNNSVSFTQHLHTVDLPIKSVKIWQKLLFKHNNKKHSNKQHSYE